MTVYLGKAMRCVNATVRDAYVKEKGLTTRIANVGQKLYCFFPSPDLFDNLNEMVINVRW
jgi:hypothetical protein